MRSSLLQRKLHCPGITSEDVRKSGLLAELTGVMSDGCFPRFADIIYCSISMLELLAVPQRGMPYVQMAFRIVLYTSNLFSSDTFDFLLMIQYIRWSCNPSCFLLVNIRCSI
jgi:hypothetical protein